MATISTEVTPFDGISSDELSAWRREPATKAMMAFLRGRKAELAEAWMRTDDPNPSSHALLKGQAVAYQDTLSMLENIP